MHLLWGHCLTYMDYDSPPKGRYQYFGRLPKVSQEFRALLVILAFTLGKPDNQALTRFTLGKLRKTALT